MTQQLPSRGFLADTASALPGAVALCLASLTSGALGALFALRCFWADRGPTVWQMLRAIFSHAVGR
jgi:hypothetical protein